MPFRPEERAAIADLVVYLSHERKHDGREGSDPPDWICEDRARKVSASRAGMDMHLTVERDSDM